MRERTYKLAQDRAPLLDALTEYRRGRVVPFDVPGHKQGRGTPELTEFLGKSCLSVDVNSMKPLDNLSHPTSVIKEAEALAADAFGAACSTMEFHAPQAGQRPAHFAVSLPHSVQ